VGNIHYDNTIIEDALREVIDKYYDPELIEKIDDNGEVLYKYYNTDYYGKDILNLVLEDTEDREGKPLIDLWYDHFPYLFEFLPQRVDLTYAVEECAKLSFRYGYDIREDYHCVQQLKAITNKTKKGKKEEIKRFQNHIGWLIHMLNGSSAKGSELQEILVDAYDNPKDYLLKLIETPIVLDFKKPTTKPIKIFLQSLGISKKPIDNYLTALKNLYN